MREVLHLAGESEFGRHVIAEYFSRGLFEVERLFQLETEGCFRGQHDFFVSGKRAAGTSRACARNRSDGRALTSASEAANQCAQARASAHHYAGTFAFALLGANHG